MNKHSFARRVAVVAGLAAASAGVQASPVCDQVYSALQQAWASGYAAYVNQLASEQSSNFGSQCFTQNSPYLATQLITATSFTQLAAVNQNLGARMLTGGGATQTAGLAGGTGMAAGTVAGEWNAWASYSGDTSTYRISNLAVTGAAGTPFNISNQNKVNNLVLGGDYRIAPSMVLGASAAFDTAAGFVNPNTTVANGTTNTSSRGQSFAAYVGWQVNNNWAIDATVGAGSGVSNPAPLTTADSTRQFGGVNLNYANWIGNWQLNGKAGYQIGTEKFDNVRRTVTLPLTYFTSRLGQAKIGGEVGYWVANGVMPYLGVAYVNDVSRNRVRVSQLWKDDAVVLTAGINFFSIKNNLTGGIVYTDESNRRFVGHSNWTANINYRF